jgi:hypothetical protein
MHSTLKPKQNDDPHDIVVVAPDAARVAPYPARVASDPVAVAPADQELSNLLHDAARRLSEAQARAGSDIPAGAVVPPVDTTFRASAVNDVLVPGRLRSIGRGAVRVFAAVLLATCIGVAGYAWEFYGDAAHQMIAQWMPQLALASSPPPEKPAPAAQPAPPAVQADTATAALAQPAPPAHTSSQVVAPSADALPADTAQLLQSMARDLASMGQEIGTLKASIEQLKASQQQISREMARASEAKASEARTSEIKPSEPSLQPRIAAPLARPAPARKLKPKPPPPLAAAAPPPPPPQAAAPSVSRQIEPPSQASAQPQAQELSPVPRPPMPLTPGIGSFQQ